MSALASIFGGPSGQAFLQIGKKVKKAARTPKPPSRRAKQAQAARRSLLEAQGRTTGSASTTATGPQGLLSDPLIGRKSLLGE